MGNYNGGGGNFSRDNRFDSRGGGGGGKKYGGGQRSFGGGGSFGGRDSGRPSMHKATCSDCGDACEVPFKPAGDKPVYCNNCFKKGDDYSNKSAGKDFGRRDYNKRDFGPKDFSKPMMHTTICSDCGDECEVPFRPSNDKPVYCNNCFKKGDNGNGGSKNNEQAKEQFEMLNAKLDKIIKLLSGSAASVEAPKKKKEVASVMAEVKAVKEEKEVEAEKPKKAAKKAVKKPAAKKVAKK